MKKTRRRKKRKKRKRRERERERARGGWTGPRLGHSPRPGTSKGPPGTPWISSNFSGHIAFEKNPKKNPKKKEKRKKKAKSKSNMAWH